MTTVLIRKGPVFLMEGSNPNMDDKQVPTYTLYASRILLWCIRYMMLQNISCILQSQDKKKGVDSSQNIKTKNHSRQQEERSKWTHHNPNSQWNLLPSFSFTSTVVAVTKGAERMATRSYLAIDVSSKRMMVNDKKITNMNECIP